MTNTLPNMTSGRELGDQDYPTFFGTRIVEVVEGIVTLTLEEMPVFVVLASGET